MDVQARKLVLSISLTCVTVISVPLLAKEPIDLGGRRIVGGEATEISQHPWQVAFNVNMDGRVYLCGGSIISDRWILTAAHCFKPSTGSSDVRVKAGATNYVQEGAWAQVDRIIIHENYNPKTHEHDIALVQLRARPQGQVIPLSSTSQELTVGQPLEVTGWGATSEEGPSSRKLLKATVPYVDSNTCNDPRSYNGAIKPGMMCAGHSDGRIDSCQGDSGGPLVWRTRNGPILVGVVSWGDGCARKLKYGVYTRVRDYRDWISRTINQRPNTQDGKGQ
jgi:trypsin